MFLFLLFDLIKCQPNDGTVCCRSYKQSIINGQEIIHRVFEIDDQRGNFNNHSTYLDIDEKYSIEFENEHWFLWDIFGPQTSPELYFQGQCPHANEVPH